MRALVASIVEFWYCVTTNFLYPLSHSPAVRRNTLCSERQNISTDASFNSSRQTPETSQEVVTQKISFFVTYCPSAIWSKSKLTLPLSLIINFIYPDILIGSSQIIILPRIFLCLATAQYLFEPLGRQHDSSHECVCVILHLHYTLESSTQSYTIRRVGGVHI